MNEKLGTWLLSGKGCFGSRLEHLYFSVEQAWDGERLAKELGSSWLAGCVCVHPDSKLRVLEMTCRSQFVSRAKDVSISTRFDRRGMGQACGAPSNKALHSVLRISPGTPGDAPAMYRVKPISSAV